MLYENPKDRWEQMLNVIACIGKEMRVLLNTAITVFKGSSSSEDGASGRVPAPKAGDQDKVLKGDGTWTDISETYAKKSDLSSHTHSYTTLTDKPNIPSKISQLTNDAGFITGSGTVNHANTASVANRVRVEDVQGLTVGAINFQKSAGSYTVSASRDAYGRLSGLNLTNSDCNCNCDCNCDCGDSDTDGA